MSSGSTTTTTDPAGLLQAVVKIANTAREDLNGKIGTAVNYDATRGRYMVSVLGDAPGAPPQMLALKPDNLVSASLTEKARQRAAEMRYYATQAMNDPAMRQQFRRFYDGVDRALPSRVKPEHTLMGIGVLLLSSAWFFGVAKTFLGGSLVLLLLMISAPDLVPQLQNGNLNLRSVLLNFPSRWKEMLVQTTGMTRMSNKVATAAFVLLLLFSGKVLLSPTPNARPATAPVSPTTNGDAVGSVASRRASVEDSYKLGFDDATAGRPYGHSLPEPRATTATTTTTTPYVDDDVERASGVSGDENIDWTYDPPPRPPPPARKNRFDFTTMMAMFTLFRTAKQLGTGPDGRPSPELLVANLRTLDPMRMGLMGLSVYRIVSAFLF